MGRLSGFNVTLRQMFKPRLTTEYPKVKRDKPERQHGRHVLNRYEDGMEKCIGCELCAGVCPAHCIYVRGADNPVDDPVSPGERYGFVYEINYLRCIHCDLCVEACPTEAITETKLFEFSFTNRADAIYTKDELRRRRRRPRQADAVGAVDRRRRRSHERVDARDLAERRGRLRRTGRLVGRARIRCAPARAGSERSRSFARRAGAALRRIGSGSLMQTLIFYICAVAVIAGALGVVLAHNPVHSALFLLLTLVSVAILFLQEDAALVAIIQIVVYASAIVVLFVFVIALLGVDQHESFDEPSLFQRPVAIVLGVLLFVQVRRARRAPLGHRRAPACGTASTRARSGNVTTLAKSLFTDYVWAFEITAVLLVIAVVGGVALGAPERPARRYDRPHVGPDRGAES